jgi:hypothetical protein
MTSVLPNVDRLDSVDRVARNDDARNDDARNDIVDIPRQVERPTRTDPDAPTAAAEHEAPDLDAVDDEAVDNQPAEAATSPAKVAPQLTERQRRMIVFERQWWRHAGSKEQAIRQQFDLSATRYYQMLNQLLDRPEALAFDPIVVGRLRRLRVTRSRTRASGPPTPIR